MLAPNDTEELRGRVLGGQFKLERLLGRGAMGAVYLAEQLEVERRVVIKLLCAADRRDARFSAKPSEHKQTERFKYEAKALAQLNHPNIVQLYAFGRTDTGLAYLAMEYVEGHTLASQIADGGALPEHAVLQILEQLSSALCAAHRQGVIHRDLKPENVMLVASEDRSPHIKVLDFGIARFTRAPELRLTRSGEILGTPLYIAPEQLRGAPADARSDLYALGVIGYELLTGRPPFEADTELELFGQVLNAPVLALHRRAPEIAVSAATEAVLLRCLAKDPDERFQSASELREQLAALTSWHAHAPGPASGSAASASAVPDLQLSIFDTSNALAAFSLTRRRGHVRRLAAASCMLALASAVALASWFDVLPGARSLRANAAELRVSDAVPLSVDAWVQGIPFPAGTEYLAFQPTFIHARIPAQAQRVAAFYRAQLAPKWGGFRELPSGLRFDSPLAPVEQLTITPSDDGTRVVITRRQLARR